MKSSFRGTIVPAITPYNSDLSLDDSGMERVLAYFDQHDGIDGIFITGATGEYDLLSMDERRRIIDIAAAMDLRKPWLINTTTRSRATSLELTEYAVSRGVGHVGVILPEECGTFGEVSEFLRSILSLGAGVFIYQTGNSPHPLSLEEMGRVLDLGGILGVKDSTSPRNMTRHIGYITEYGRRMTVIQGVENLYLCSLVMGVHGVIGGGCNVYPQLFGRIRRSFGDGDIEGARARQILVNRWIDGIYEEGTGNESMKYCLSLFGVKIGWYSRRTSAPLSEGKMRLMQQIYQQIEAM